MNETGYFEAFLTWRNGKMIYSGSETIIRIDKSVLKNCEQAQKALMTDISVASKMVEASCCMRWGIWCKELCDKSFDFMREVYYDVHEERHIPVDDVFERIGQRISPCAASCKTVFR